MTALLALVLAIPLADADAGFKPMFNGKDFTGWKKVGGGATYHWEDDCIVGKVGPGPNTFLRTEKTYGDFILKLEFKLDIPGNSGIQFRSHQREGDGRVFGYQCEIDPSDRKWSGGIYDEARRGWLFPLTGLTEAQNAFKLEDWNEYVIQAVGPSIKTWVNGVPCADLIDTMDMEGFIALQVHSGKEGQIRWRNVQIKELGKTEWKPIWNGKDPQGWKSIGGGKWNVQDGTIVGTASKSDEKHGYLVSENTYGDFAVRLQFKADSGDSGLYFRATSKNDQLVGLQAQIHAATDVGGIYDISGRGWLARPKKEDLEKHFHPGKWNQLAVVAIGPRIVVQLNGQTTAELKNDPSSREGALGLQVHAKDDVQVQFKDIEVIELQTADK